MLVVLVMLLAVPVTHEAFIKFTKSFPYSAAFIKFAVLATMGELLALRISSKNWLIPAGAFYRAIIWGFLGIVITLMFQIFLAGVQAGISNGYLPGEGSTFALAFFVSATLNLAFAPTFMAFHRYTDTYIDLVYEGKRNITVEEVAAKIDWGGFITFVLLKTVPLFWIPAHTITFLLPPEYRVLFAACLSIVLGALLAFGKRADKKSERA